MKRRILTALVCLSLLFGMLPAASAEEAANSTEEAAAYAEETAASAEEAAAGTEEAAAYAEEAAAYAEETADPAGMPDEVTIYAVDTALADEISVPDGFPQSYSLRGHTWEVIEGKSVEIDEAGSVNIVKTTWYYHTTEDGWTVGSTSPSGSADEVSCLEYSFGDAVILVDGTHRLTVHAVDYARYYAEGVMNDYLAANISPGMSQYEIASLCCRFVAEGYDYSVNASDYTSMIVTGGGDCWASASALLYMLERQGIACSSRNGSADPGTGRRHINVLAQLDGSYYILEAGIVASAPRPYTMTALESASIFTYSLRGNTARITGLVLDNGITDLVIPEKIDGYTVTAIADGAFSGNSRLVSVTLPDTVTYLGVKAFFQNESLESVTLSERLVTIGANCFTWDEALKEVSIPASVVEMGSNVFCYCDALTAIHVDPANQVYCSVDGVLYDKAMQTLLVFPGGKGDWRPDQISLPGYFSELTECYIVPDGVKYIDGWAFAGVNLAWLRLPDTLEDIRSRAFYYSYIGTIEIPESITVISAAAFYDATLSTLRLPASLRRIESDAFGRAGIYSPVELPDGLEYVGQSAFSGVQGLYVRVPASVREIGSGAFDFQHGWSSMGDSNTEKTGYEGAILFDEGCDPDTIGENAFGREVLCVYPDSPMHHYAQQNGLFWHPLNSDGKIELKQEWLEGFYSSSRRSYTGLPITPDLKWESSSKGVCPFWITSDAYEAVCTDNINIGTGTVTATGKGFFTGTVTATFRILPARPDAGVIDRSGCGLQYRIENGQAHIVSYIAGALPRHAVIPETLDGYPVTEICELAFEGRELDRVPDERPLDLASVTIPASVTEIDHNAFSHYEQAGEHTYLYTLPSSLVIYAQRGSYAETYAKDRGIFFVPITSQTDRFAPQLIELVGWSLAANGTTAVQLVDSTNALEAGASVYAAQYDEDGRMIGFLAGSIRDGSVIFERPLSERWFLYILNGDYQPIVDKRPLSLELYSHSST